MAELLKAHAAVIEWPPKEWLTEQFPKTNWAGGAGLDMFGQQWTAYSLSWNRVLAAWDEAENYTVLRPAIPMPFGGMRRAIAWSRARGEAKQQELIGMTAEAEIDMAYLVSYGASAATGASTGKATQPAPVAAATFETEDT